jgi:DNA-binding response OmpR family regulator
MLSGDAGTTTAAGTTGKPWAVALLSEDAALGREFALAVAHEDFRFSYAHPQATEGFLGGLATFDLVLFYLARDPLDGCMPRELLAKHQGCVVVLGYRATGMERAWWIDNGADDCLSHPCDHRELLARLRASIRRRRSAARSHDRLTVGALTLSLTNRTATLRGRQIALTTCEFSLLGALAARAGQVLGREQLLEFAKGSADQAFERAIDVQISRLRAKLHDNPRQPRMLKTVRGAGYVLVATDAV